jgi:hypothetical protein
MQKKIVFGRGFLRAQYWLFPHLGWYLTGKTNLKVGGKTVSVQIGMNLTIVGSKELPKE